MALNLMILTNYFAIDPENMGGGIGYRYVGLYGSLVRKLLNNSRKSKVFWYSNRDRILRVMSRMKVEEVKCSMKRAVINAILNTLRNREYMIVIVAYPYAVPSIVRIFDYVLPLLTLKIFSLSGRIKIIIDDFDPPVESAYAFSETKPSLFTVVHGRMLEMLSLRLASSIIAVSESYRAYLAKTYRIKKEKFFVISNGCLVRFVQIVPPRTENPFRILYAGSAIKSKDVGKLVSVIDALRQDGLNIELYVAGAKLMDLPDWVQYKSCKWFDFIENLLSKSDLGVIPYPPNKLHFYFAMPAKLFDYMAAGKPVVSTNLKEVARVINAFECGLVAKNWDEFRLHIETLYYDRELAKRLGENGRKAVEEHFNYEILAGELLRKMIDMFSEKE